MVNKDLATFIVRERAEGVSDADISAALIGRGWNPNDVEEAIAMPPLALATPAPALPTTGALLSDTFASYRKRFMLLFLIALPPALMSIIAGLFSDPALMFGDGAPVFDPSVFVGVIVGAFVMVFLYLLSGVATILAVADETITSPVVAWERALPVLPRYFVTSLFVGVWICIGFLLLIIPGIIFSVQYTFSALVSVLEGKKATEAMAQSKSYVKGRWGAVAGRLFLGMVVVVLANMTVGLLTAPLGFLPEGDTAQKALSHVSGAVFSGFIAVYMYTLYLRLKGI